MGGGGYETHPPEFWENLGTQNCPTPTGGGGVVGQPATHPLASHQSSTQDRNASNDALSCTIIPKVVCTLEFESKTYHIAG